MNLKINEYVSVRVIVALAIAFGLTFTITTFAFGGYSAPTAGEWYNISWHYRIRVEVNTTVINSTNWPIELQINFTDLLPEGTFDNSSVRVIEYNLSEKVKNEVSSQFDKGGGYNETTNAVGEVIFILNGTTLPNSKRIFYIYFDTLENGAKQPRVYPVNVNYSWDGQIAKINSSDLRIEIDTNRGDNASGIYNVVEKNSGVPVIIGAAGQRPAEYLEFFNGSVNTTFDLIGNATFVRGPVRLTIIQEGQEVVLGNVSQKTLGGRIIKKYYFYGAAGPQAQGAFIKISHEFIANGSINRSSNVGAVALDFARTSLAQDMNQPDNSSTDPYSWVYASDSGGSVAGIINLNESTPNYFAAHDTSLGRMGVTLTNTGFSSIKQTSLLYFAVGAAQGASEFLAVRNTTFYQPIVRANLTEKLITSIKPQINRTMFNLNETIPIKANISQGDPYGLIAKINATIDIGTAPASDDVKIQLYDDGTNGDETAGDKIFTSNYTILINATLGEWKINFTGYTNSSEYLNSTIFTFNVTNVYYVNITIFNAIGIVSRQVYANITVMNFNRSLGIPGAFLNCTFNSVNVVNKTDNGNGIYSINFTAPASIGTFNLFCNATKYNNTGNDTKSFTTENPKTYINFTAVPQSFVIPSVSLYGNATAEFFTNATNVGNGTAKNTNVTIVLLSGWSVNTTFVSCGDIAVNASCIRWFNLTVPNATAPGNYTINITMEWTNPNDSYNFTGSNLTVTVNPNPIMNVTQNLVNGTGADGTQKTVGIFNVLSVGNYLVNIITFNCTAGPACQSLNISFTPQNITNATVGSNITVYVISRVPLNYTPGVYNGTINVTGAGRSFILDLYIDVQNKTNLSVTTQPSSVVVTGISIFTGASFPIVTNVTNIENSSARNTTINFTLPVNWTINSSFEICGTLTYNSSCFKNNTINVPNSTVSGNYTVNITVRWLNNDNTNGSKLYALNVTIAESPVVIFENNSYYGAIHYGVTSNLFNITVFSVGASAVNNIGFNCTSGVVCANFSPTFAPSVIASLGPGLNATIKINFTVPSMFHAGNYTGILNMSSSNAENKTTTLVVEVFPNRTWTMTPVFCKRSMYPDYGKVCDINVTNTGNAVINFTIINTIQNYTFTNVTNFSIDQYENYTFSVWYNVTGIQQFIYNSTFVVQSLDSASPQNMSFNISLLPSTPPVISIIAETLIEQTDELAITANITDMADSGIYSVNVTVVRFNGTIDEANMTLISSVGNRSLWTVVYAANITNYTFGDTLKRGLYNITIRAADNLGNVGNSSANFTVRKKVNIASNTLSQQYVQGDTGTIYYSARNLTNAGIPDINVTFWLYDPNMTLIYMTNRTTDSIGTFTPLPVFALASDAPVGNYILISNSTFVDEELNRTFTVTKNYTAYVMAKTVVVTGLFADIETAVVWFPNNVMRFNILVYDGEGRAVDPTNMILTVYDPAQNVYFITNFSSMTKRGTGFYAYSYAMPTTTATGMYLAVVNVTRNNLATLKLKAFRVAQGGPYDVRITLAKNEVSQGTPLDFVLTIENKGEVTQDVFVNYSVTSLSTGTTYYFASEAVLTPAFTNQSFTRSAFIYSNQPLGNYLLKAIVKYDNTQPEINASASFLVLAARAQPPPPTPSGGGGGGGAGGGEGVTGEIVQPEAEAANSLTIEKYNKEVRVYPGFKRVEYVIVKNTGRNTLSGVSLNIIGLQTSWYNITPVIYNQMIPGNSSVFLVEYNVPEGIGLGEYQFNLVATSSTTSDQKSAILKVVGSIQDIILADIAQLKEDLKNLLIDIGVAKNQGKDVDDVLLLADEVQKYINRAEINYNLNNTKETLDNINSAKITLEKARNLLNRLQIIVSGGADAGILIILVIIPIAVIVIFIILRRKKKVPKQLSQTVSSFVTIIEKIHKGSTDTSALNREREKLNRMVSVLEKEKDEKIISEQAYNEMKKNIESKLQHISKKLKS